MSQLLWWAIFLVPTLVAVVWALWRAYPTGDDFDSVAAHHRFVEALARTERKADRAGQSDRTGQTDNVGKTNETDKMNKNRETDKIDMKHHPDRR